MKKITAYAALALILGSLLSGCYSRACDQPNPTPMNYKDEVK